MKHKYTPSPWLISDNCLDSHYTILDGSRGARVGRVLIAQRVSGYTSEESIANARLIAAAPDLLSELRDLAGFIEKYGHTVDRAAFMRNIEGYLIAAKGAISKAQGTT